MRFKNALKRFAYETFRPHSKEEYAELFSRGHGGDEKTPYPWFYARVLLISLLLFTVLCVGYSLSKLNFLMVAAAGGFFADLTFIVLLVEIYPKRDLPLITPILALFAGGILSSAFIYMLYGIDMHSAAFVDQAWTAFVEETGKALATIIILLIVKKRNPFACFIIGAAVGGGYSAFENMWYMYTQGFGWSGLPQAIETGLWRALGTPFSHAAWAGLFGWALAFKGKAKWWHPRKVWIRKLCDWALSGEKTWLSWKPYAMYAFGYTMHFFVNFPLMQQFAEWKGYPISAVTGILSIALIIFVLVQSRRKLVDLDVQAEPFEPLQPRGNYKISGTYPKINGAYAAVDGTGVIRFPDYGVKYRFIANVLAAAAIFCFSFTLLGPTCVFGGYAKYRTYYYDTWEEVLNVVQEGREISPDYGRKYVVYDDLSQNYSYTWTDGELISATQRERYGNYYFRFTYGYSIYYSTFEDEEGNFFVWVDGENIPIESEDGILPESVRIWELKNVALELNDYLYYPRNIIISNTNIYTKYSADSSPSPSPASREVYRYYLLNLSVSYVGVNPKGGFEVDLQEQAAIRETESVIFSAVFFAAFLGCGVAYIVYKSKIRRLKNVER